MPIRPPNLDDRRYDDLLREARALIPQYCPEWTNLSDADPGMTLVQLFSWMTELIIFRLNQVPDKTYIHFLNFIGEERRPARPAVAPLTFTAKVDRPVEIPAFTRCATRQREDSTASDYVTTEAITVHGSTVGRLMAVRGGPRAAVRELPFALLGDNRNALQLGGGRGVDLFDLDPVEFGADAWTAHQYLYLTHDDIALMGGEPDPERPPGRLRLRRASKDAPDHLSIAGFFDWEYPTAEGWLPIPVDEDEPQLGMPETTLVSELPGVVPIDALDLEDDWVALPDPVADARWWIRGRVDYERWLAARMEQDLAVAWRDDRGGEERTIHNWTVGATGRALEFFLQDLPPIRGGWTIRLSLVDRGLPAGRNQYLPRYRWSYRRGHGWEEIPPERVRHDGMSVLITGPLPDMATDEVNLRAERVETVFLPGLLPELEPDLTWVRPIEIDMFAGDDPRRLERLLVDEGPWSPFQLSPVLPPTIGRKWYLGSDLFENRKKARVTVELDVVFEMNGVPVPEPVDAYLLQLTYRADDNWRVVWSEDKVYAAFTFAQLDAREGRPDAAARAGARTLRLVLDPETQLRGLARHEVGGVETTWVRMELVKSMLTGADEKKNQLPIVPRILAVRLGVDGALDADTYEQPLPNPRVLQVDYRAQNRRLSRMVARAVGRTHEFWPFFPYVDIQEPNQALYLQFDRPLPTGRNHAVVFRTRGETWLPHDVRVEWEVLEHRGNWRWTWRRLHAAGEEAPYALTGTGVLRFSLPEDLEPHPDGFWIRARFAAPADTPVDALPRVPPLVHVMLNTVDVVNVVTVRTERASGLGIPNQVVQLRRAPLFLHDLEKGRSPFRDPDAFPDVKVLVETEDGPVEEWFRVSDQELLTASKDDRIFVVDPVEGTLTFGNGIRGRMLPVGSANVIIDTYRYLPGARGNVGAREVSIVEGFADVVRAENLLPASGGRDAETVEEIIRRAPSLLTNRDRAVTRSDFATIATEASAEVARADCDGRIGDDGTVRVIILPHRREGERVPDPMLSVGLRDHVQQYLKRRCLINVTPDVRLARFLPIDVSITLRLRPNANLLAVRDQSTRWVERFLDPYAGGLDGTGWPFGGTLYAQDFARIVADVPEVRHVVDVRLHVVEDERRRAGGGWEESEGVAELPLAEHDLFALRRVRVRTEGTGE